jgi:hypothetical protein
VAISEHFTFSKAQTLTEVQSLIEQLNRHFCQLKISEAKPLLCAVFLILSV